MCVHFIKLHILSTNKARSRSLIKVKGKKNETQIFAIYFELLQIMYKWISQICTYSYGLYQGQGHCSMSNIKIIFPPNFCSVTDRFHIWYTLASHHAAHFSANMTRSRLPLKVKGQALAISFDILYKLNFQYTSVSHGAAQFHMVNVKVTVQGKR